jgi:hypothetical protein
MAGREHRDAGRQDARRLEQSPVRQRLFGWVNVAAPPKFFIARTAITRYRILMWTLERIGIRAPSVYAQAARHAARIGASEGRHGFEAQAQFQGALAILARATMVTTLNVEKAQALLEKLTALPLTEDGRYAGAIARWLRSDLGGAIKSAETSELAVLAAMSGPPSGDGPTPRPVTWEGQSLASISARPSGSAFIVREKQEGALLDVPLDLAAAARGVAADKIAIGDVEPIVTKLTEAIDQLPRRVDRDNEETTPPGVPAAPNARDTLRKLTEELTKDLRNKDLKRIVRASEQLLELSDRVLANVLMSIAYAADVGDPDGTVMLAEDVSRRQDFGFNTRESEARLRIAWAMPRVEVTPGLPWHVDRKSVV